MRTAGTWALPGASRAGYLFFESSSRSVSLFEHDLLGKPVSAPHQVGAGLFPDHALRMRNGIRVTCAMPEGNARGMKCWGRKNLPREASIAGPMGLHGRKTSSKIGGFCNGTALAEDPARPFTRR